KIAREHQIDIEKLKGTGYDGRVLEKDVYAYLGAQEDGEIENKDNQTSLNTLPFKGIRKQIAKNMSNSVRTIQQVTHYEEVDVTELIKLREELKEMNINISIVAFFQKALSFALHDYPIFNAELDEVNEVIRLYEDINIGMATD